jgi:hypothetical protein
MAREPAREGGGDFDLEYSFADRASVTSGDVAMQLCARCATPVEALE